MAAEVFYQVIARRTKVQLSLRMHFSGTKGASVWLIMEVNMSAKWQIFYFLRIKTGIELMLKELFLTDPNKRDQAMVPNISVLLPILLPGGLCQVRVLSVPVEH